MKKFWGIFLFVVLLLSFCSCNRVENTVLDNYKNHFSAVTDFAFSYYFENHNNSDEHLTLVFDNGNIKNEEDILEITNELSDSVKIIVENDFDYLWVAENYVIFWRDETKYYGLIGSECAVDIIKIMKNKWYSTIEYNRIDGNWYEIGVLSSF